jgi:hypothetical protein
MITKEEVNQIINKPKPSYEDKINVIAKYIFDLKQEDISVVKINPPQNDVMEAIMEHMFTVSSNYYHRGEH